MIKLAIGKNVLSKKEFAKRMKEIEDQYAFDPEVFHIEADLLMEQLLFALGYKEGVTIFDMNKKWYA